jgi:protein TonB
MFLLPTFNAQLRPCPVSAAAFSPHAQGQFCNQCQRVVQDFSQSTNPVADLAAARAASPDGRVCGSFRVTQVQRPKLTQRLRWFVVALVLVVAQGLSAREALAQVRKTHAAKTVYKRPPGPIPMSTPPESTYGDVEELLPNPATATPQTGKTYCPVFPMPSYRGGGMKAIVSYIQQQVVWPRRHGKILLVEGKVFASFTVGTDGQVHDVEIVKGLHPLFDAEVLRAIRTLRGVTPSKENGLPVATNMTVPITFKLE